MSVTTTTHSIITADSGSVRLEIRGTTDAPMVSIITRTGNGFLNERYVGSIMLDDLEALFDAAGQLVTYYEGIES